MNKRINAICLVAVVLASSNAFASRARQVVMGTADPLQVLSGGSHGSFFYDDNNNIFYNPSYANEFKNWATIEKSNGLTSGTTAATVANAGAEGGFVASMMNFSLGAYFDRGDALQNNVTAFSDVANLRPIDIIIAGDMGVKWGLGFTTSTSTGNSGSKSVLRAGAQIMDVEPFLDFTLKGREALGAGEIKYSGFGGGLKYHYGEWTPFFGIRSNKVDTTSIAGGVATTYSSVGGGLGRNMKMGEGVRMNYALSYWTRSGTGDERKILPIDVSVEGEMTSWLTGRAGLQYRLVDRSTITGSGKTTGRIGLTINVSKINVDWAVGGSPNAAQSFGQVDSASFDLGGGMFSVASLTYKW